MSVQDREAVPRRWLRAVAAPPPSPPLAPGGSTSECVLCSLRVGMYYVVYEWVCTMQSTSGCVGCVRVYEWVCGPFHGASPAWLRTGSAGGHRGRPADQGLWVGGVTRSDRGLAVSFHVCHRSGHHCLWSDSQTVRQITWLVHQPRSQSDQTVSGRS